MLRVWNCCVRSAKKNSFDEANPFRTNTCPGVILPAILEYQFAMWRYDKGGSLQRLLHNIKYNGLGRLGFELGCLLGERLRNCPAVSGYLNSGTSMLLVPVPLHPRRKRMRGFNQAELIAMGISSVTGIPVADDAAVSRSRYTRTQTGFSLLARNSNMAGAFQLEDEQALAGKHLMLVDDVFTTGATTYALATCLREAAQEGMGVVTIAYAP